MVSATGSTERWLRPSSLRFRVSVSFFALSVVLSTLFAVAAWVTVELMEAEFLEEFLGLELRDFVERMEADPTAPLPTSGHTRGYLVEGGDDRHLPGYLRGLPPGTHELEELEGAFEVLVTERGQRRFLLVYNEGEIEIVERRLLVLLAAGVLAFSTVGFWTGYGASSRIIAPVRSLAERVARLGTEAAATSLAEDFAADEVGALAQAFDRYAARLSDFVWREREFTADVSHEFRTSLSIILSAADLVRLEFEERGLRSEALERLCRAAGRMTRLVEGFLLLAREADGEGTRLPACDVADLLRNLVEERRLEAERKGLRLELQIRANVRLEVPETAVEVTVGNLLANAIRYSEQGTIRVVLDTVGITVEDEGLGIPPEELPWVTERSFRGGHRERPGTGLGLAIVERFCRRFGWNLEISSQEGRGTRAHLCFTAPATAGVSDSTLS